MSSRLFTLIATFFVVMSANAQQPSASWSYKEIATDWWLIDPEEEMGDRVSFMFCYTKGEAKVDVVYFFEKYGRTSLAIPEQVTLTYVDSKDHYAEKQVNCTVREVNYEAFANQNVLEKVSLPSTVTWIGNRAFSGCSKLEEINLPDALTFLGDNVFWGCSGLKAIQLPATLEQIGSMVFSKCDQLTTVCCDAIVPPECASNTLCEETIYKQATLIVPAGSIDAYRTAKGWKNFFSIEAEGANGIGGPTVDDRHPSDRSNWNLQGQKVKSGAKGQIHVSGGKKLLVK